MIKNFFRSEKISSQADFTHFRFKVKTLFEQIVRPVKKTQENQYSSSSRKNQEKANNSPSFRCAATKYNLLKLGELLSNARLASVVLSLVEMLGHGGSGWVGLGKLDERGSKPPGGEGWTGGVLGAGIWKN